MQKRQGIKEVEVDEKGNEQQTKNCLHSVVREKANQHSQIGVLSFPPPLLGISNIERPNQPSDVPTSQPVSQQKQQQQQLCSIESGECTKEEGKREKEY